MALTCLSIYISNSSMVASIRELIYVNNVRARINLSRIKIVVRTKNRRIDDYVGFNYINYSAFFWQFEFVFLTKNSNSNAFSLNNTINMYSCCSVSNNRKFNNMK